MEINYLSHRSLAIPYTYRILAGSLACFGFLLIYLGFFPGFMSADSINQYDQALAHIYLDLHPPIMAWVWSKLNLLTPGPQNLLVMNLLFLFSGLSLFYFSYDKYSPKCALIFFAIPFFPPILVYTGYLWKDVGMAFSWLLAIAIINYLHISGRLNFKTILLPFVFFLYGLLIRHNSIFGAIPIIFYSLTLVFPQAKALKKIIYTILIAVGLMGSGYIINFFLIGAHHSYPESQIMIDDIDHISFRTGKNYFPQSFKIDDGAIQKCSQELTNTIWCFSPALTSTMFHELKSTWIKVVLEHFPIYLKYRTQAYIYLLRVTPFSNDPKEFKLNTIDNNFGIKFEPNMISNILQKIIDYADSIGILFKSYFWLGYSIILFICVYLLPKSPARIVARYLLLSGIFYLLGYCLISTSNEFRYCYWTILTATLSSCLLLVKTPKLRVQPITSL